MDVYPPVTITATRHVLFAGILTHETEPAAAFNAFIWLFFLVTGVSSGMSYHLIIAGSQVTAPTSPQRHSCLSCSQGSSI